MIPDFLNERLGVWAGIITSVGVLFGVVPALRRFVVNCCKLLKRYAAGPLLLEKIASEVAMVKKEVMHNGGGSMKDIVASLRVSQERHENYRRHDFWMQGCPAMELDGQGHVQLASEAALRLFHVSTPQELFRRSWLRFLDSDEVDDFLRAFTETAASDSLFRFEIQIRGNKGENRGKWVFRAMPIKPDVGDAKLYSGRWSPVDSTATEIADRHRWEIRV